MSNTKPAGNTWRPRGRFTWVLTLGACLLLVLMVGLAYGMMVPIRWDGPGKLAALALFFPLHLLVVTVVAAVLAGVARRYRAGLAAAGFGLVVSLTVVMALVPAVPAVAVWQQAGSYRCRCRWVRTWRMRCA